jgi:hypothetical protein
LCGWLTTAILTHSTISLHQAPGPGLLAIIGGAFLFASWIFGTVLDSIRNGVVENIVDWCSRHWFHKPALNWEFFVTGDSDKVTRRDEYFFAYYKEKRIMPLAF